MATSYLQTKCGANRSRTGTDMPIYRAGNNQFESNRQANQFKSIRYGESKTNMVQFGRGHVIRSLHIAQHTTLQIMKEIRKMLNEIFF